MGDTNLIEGTRQTATDVQASYDGWAQKDEANQMGTVQAQIENQKQIQVGASGVPSQESP